MECLSCSLLLVFFRSRLIWDPALSLLVLPLLSFLCCLDPGLSGTAPPFRLFALFRFPVFVLFRSRLIWDQPLQIQCSGLTGAPLSFSEMHYLSVFGAPVASSCYRCIEITHGVPLMFSPACVLQVPAYLGPSPFFIGATIAFFLVLFRSRLIWDSPAFSFVCSFLLSCFCFVQIPAYLGLAPLDFVLWLNRSSPFLF